MRMNSRQLEKYQATLEGLLREVLPPTRNGTGYGVGGHLRVHLLQRSPVGFRGAVICFSALPLRTRSCLLLQAPPPHPISDGSLITGGWRGGAGKGLWCTWRRGSDGCRRWGALFPSQRHLQAPDPFPKRLPGRRLQVTKTPSLSCRDPFLPSPGAPRGWMVTLKETLGQSSHKSLQFPPHRTPPHPSFCQGSLSPIWHCLSQGQPESLAQS